MNAKKTKNKSAASKKPSKKAQPKISYLDESVKDYDFSDYVKITSMPRGMILSFGKWIPENKEYCLFHEVLLPFEVAESLSNIIQRQLKELVESGKIKVLQTPEEGE